MFPVQPVAFSSSRNIVDISAMFNLIFSQVYTGDNKLISSAFNQTLPKIYAISMMYTLNARRELRAGSVQDMYSSGQPTAPRVCDHSLYSSSIYTHSSARTWSLQLMTGSMFAHIQRRIALMYVCYRLLYGF